MSKQDDALVTCLDGKRRLFIARDDSDYMSYQGTKHRYVLLAEPEGRGYITMQVVSGVLILAPNRMQPNVIEASTWAGQWIWQRRDSDGQDVKAEG